MVNIRLPVGEQYSHAPPAAWTIRVENANPQAHTFACQEKNVCFISANTKLAGFDKMVRLSNPELAQSFIDALKEVMTKRHGDLVQLEIEPFTGSDRRVVFDDEVVLARIKTRNFAPNKAPSLVSDRAPGRA